MKTVRVFLLCSFVAVTSAGLLPESLNNQQCLPDTEYGKPFVTSDRVNSYSESVDNNGYVYEPKYVEGSTLISSSISRKGETQVTDLKPIIQKSVYIHVAPRDFEEEKEAVVQASAPRINYKIIFIKAPIAPSIPQHIIQQQQVKDKTIVYVLVKKPDVREAVKIAGLAPIAPSKPEVFFIKYKGEKTAEVQTEQVDSSSQTKQSVYGPPARITKE